MYRRDFLKVAGMAAASLVFRPGLTHRLAQQIPVETAIAGRLYRGTLDGKIYTSDDGGASWQLHTNLGPKYSVLRFYAGSTGLVHTQVGFSSYSFDLALLKNGKAWMTVARA